MFKFWFRNEELIGGRRRRGLDNAKVRKTTKTVKGWWTSDGLEPSTETEGTRVRDTLGKHSGWLRIKYVIEFGLKKNERWWWD